MEIYILNTQGNKNYLFNLFSNQSLQSLSDYSESLSRYLFCNLLRLSAIAFANVLVIVNSYYFVKVYYWLVLLYFCGAAFFNLTPALI